MTMRCHIVIFFFFFLDTKKKVTVVCHRHLLCSNSTIEEDNDTLLLSFFFATPPQKKMATHYHHLLLFKHKKNKTHKNNIKKTKRREGVYFQALALLSHFWLPLLPFCFKHFLLASSFSQAKEKKCREGREVLTRSQLFEGLKCESQIENNERARNWGCSLARNT
jgi:hypothetical protein